MQRKYVASLAVLLAAVAAAVLLVGTGSPAKPLPEEVRPTTAAPKLVVHEWGTFTSFSGADGKPLKFVHKSDDLPDFVHEVYMGKGGDGYDPYSPVSLETPVLYFYTDREARVSVQVDFPKGMMSEWYPQAQGLTHRNSQRIKRLVWKDVQLAPNTTGTRVQLPLEQKKSHYYAARETDAVPLRVGKEQEKFIFYRGVADFAPPLSVQALGLDDFGNERFRVKNSSKEKVGMALVIQIEGNGDAVRYATVGSLEGGAEIETGFRCKGVMGKEELGEVMVGALVGAGLYEKEARAMVKTWKADWFADVGTRLLYVAPTKLADDILPLKIDPKPAEVVRVLVGRHDILTPGDEREADQAVKELDKLNAEWRAIVAKGDVGPQVERKAIIEAKVKTAEAALRQRFGRFAWPAREAATARLPKK